MKLLHCLSSLSIGGIERLVIELAIVQFQSGMDVSIMLDSKKGAYYDYLTKQNIPLLESNIKGGFDFSFATYKQLKEKFKKFDIVHLHSFSPIQLAAVKHSRTKIVYTIHGLSKGIRAGNSIKNLLRETLKQYFLNKVNLLVANSNYTLSLAKQHYNLKNTNSLCILNGIRISESSITSNKQNKEFTIGLVSRFTKRKRIDRLIEAFKKYKELSGKGKLVLVGDGSEFSTIQKMVQELGLKNEVDLVGYSTKVADYYNKFDLCVFPSQEEPFGLVAVEAYLQGKAVLAFDDSGGLKEVIAPLEPENIVTTVDDLANRLLYWDENETLLQKKAEQRISYATKHFSVERMASDYLMAYNQVLNEQ